MTACVWVCVVSVFLLVACLSLWVLGWSNHSCIACLLASFISVLFLSEVVTTGTTTTEIRIRTIIIITQTTMAIITMEEDITMVTITMEEDIILTIVIKIGNKYHMHHGSSNYRNNWNNNNYGYNTRGYNNGFNSNSFSPYQYNLENNLDYRRNHVQAGLYQSQRQLWKLSWCVQLQQQ